MTGPIDAAPPQARVPPARRQTLLAGVPALSALPAEVLRELAAELGEEFFPAGSTVVTEGELAHRLYVIVEGRAEVTAAGPGGPTTLSTLVAGELFGEIALLSPSAQRTAT